MTTAGGVSRQIFSSAIVIGALTLLVSLAAFVRDLIIAATLGRGDALESYLIAILLPSFLVNVLTTSIGPALIPAYVHARTREGVPAAHRLLQMVFAIAIVVLLGASAVLAVGFKPLVPLLASNFGAAKQALSLQIFWFVLPTLLLSGLANIIAASLNAEQRFGWPAGAAALPPLFAVMGLLLFQDRLGVFALALGTTTGAAAQLAVVAAVALRTRLPVTPRRPVAGDAFLVRMREQYLPIAFGALLLSGTNVIDSAMAASLDPGSVAAWSFGTRVVVLVVGVGSLALNTAVLPHFSEMVARHEWAKLKEVARNFTWLAFAVTVPLVVVIFLFAEPIVRILFERGQFSAEDTKAVARVLEWFSLQIPFYLVAVLYARVLSALARNQVLLAGNIISLTLKVALNVALIAWLGVTGLAIATSVVLFASFLFLYSMARAEIARREAAAAQ